MTVNMGKSDRTIRILAAAVFAVLILAGAVGGALAVILGILTVVLFVTAAVGYCPAYRLLGISTKKHAPAQG